MYVEDVEVMQEELNVLIERGVQKITTLVRNTEISQTMDIESGKNVFTLVLHLHVPSMSPFFVPFKNGISCNPMPPFTHDVKIIKGTAHNKW